MEKNLNSPVYFRKFADIFQEKRELELEIKKLVSYINRFAQNYKQLLIDIENAQKQVELLKSEENKFQTNLDIFQEQQGNLEKKKETVTSPKELRSVTKEFDYLMEQIRKKEDALLFLQEKKETLSQNIDEKKNRQKELKKQHSSFMEYYSKIEALEKKVLQKKKELLNILVKFSLPVQHSLQEVIDKNSPDPFTSIQDYSYCRLCGVKLPESLNRAVKRFSSYHEERPLLRCQGCGRIIIDVKSTDPMQ